MTAASANEEAVFDALKLEVNVWESLADALYYITVSTPEDRPAALARYQDDATDFATYLGALRRELENDNDRATLETIIEEWTAVKALTDALIADVDAEATDSEFESKVRTVWHRTIALEDRIEDLAIAVRD